MQTVEAGHEVEANSLMSLARRLLKAYAIAQPMCDGMSIRLFDEEEETDFSKAFAISKSKSQRRSQHRRPWHPTFTSLQLRQGLAASSVQCLPASPSRKNAPVAPDRHPAENRPSAHRHLFGTNAGPLVLPRSWRPRCRTLRQINRTVLFSKDHGLFWRQTEFPRGRVVIDEAVRRLSDCPLADISFPSARPPVSPTHRT